MKNYVLLSFAFAIWTGSLIGQELGQQTLAQLEASPAGANVIKFLRAINETETFTEKHIPELFAQSLIASMLSWER